MVAIAAQPKRVRRDQAERPVVCLLRPPFRALRAHCCSTLRAIVELALEFTGVQPLRAGRVCCALGRGAGAAQQVGDMKAAHASVYRGQGKTRRLREGRADRGLSVAGLTIDLIG